MTLALSCVVCLVGAGPAATPPSAPVTPVFGFALKGIATPAAPGIALGAFELAPRLSVDALALAHDHGSAPAGDDSHHGSWMTTTMLIVMVAMMVTVGAVMMARGTRLGPEPAGGPASRALPQSNAGLASLPGR